MTIILEVGGARMEEGTGKGGARMERGQGREGHGWRGDREGRAEFGSKMDKLKPSNTLILQFK